MSNSRETGVRERVGDISQQDAIAEGMAALKADDLRLMASFSQIERAIAPGGWLDVLTWWRDATAVQRFCKVMVLLSGPDALQRECTAIEFEVVR